MKIYYLQSEYQANKHRIAACVYDADLFRFDTSVLSSYSVMQIDEIDPANKALCIDLCATVNKTDANGEGKYFVNNSAEIMEAISWQEAIDA